MASIIDSDVTVNGTLTATGNYTGNIARTNLITEAASPIGIPITDFRNATAFATILTATASGADLGIVGGTFATSTPSIQTSNMDATTVTQRARVVVMIPHTYVATAAAAIRFSAGMLGATASANADLDVEAYLFARDTLKSGSDLITTSAQSINSLTFAPFTFTLNPTTLTPGAWLDIRVAITGTDAGGGASTIAAISNVELLFSTKG